MALRHLAEEALVPGEPSSSGGGFDDSRRRRLLWLLNNELGLPDRHQRLAHFYYLSPSPR
jgi:hypothetical protein